MRFLLAPRQLLLHVVALLLICTMAALCWWQLSKASSPHAADSGEPEVSLQTLSQPGVLNPEAFNRPVSATGLYLPALTVGIPNRMLHGRSGTWVLTPLRLPDGSLVPVVRGWTQSPLSSARPSLAQQVVQVHGQFLPPEQSPDRVEQLAANQIAAVELAQLAARWGNAPLHEGYLLAELANSTTADLPGVELVTIPVTNAETSDTGAPFSNAAYALQWLAFSAFVMFLWGHILRDGWHRNQQP